MANMVRSNKGAGLVELCISVVVMGIVSSAIFGILVATTNNAKSLNNKCDAIDMARNSMEKIGRDVRMGRIIGDCFGNFDPTLGTNGAQTGSNSFPSALNPLYSIANGPPGGWPSGTSGSATAFGGPPYVISNQTLVVQVPIFDRTPGPNLGYPTVINANAIAPGVPAQARENVETHIYRVFRDPDQINNPNEFVLEWMKLPGRNNSTNQMPPRVGPIRICSGIVGPRAPGQPNGVPRVFQYLYALDPSGPARNGFEHPPGTPRPTWGALFNGVIVNLEVCKHKDTSRVNNNWRGLGTLAIRSEFFMRNNTQATAAGVPQN